MKASDIRSTFLKFFESKGHTIVPSSPVVPGDDPTLLFTNAGMNQFKDVFLGFDKRPYTRATTAQKCIRAGGKHNDLENVGYTARHHTFFEMLGNFSFGDYFKKEAIAYAWELLTEVYKLPKEKLWVTVYAEDDEAYDIWNKEVGVPAERIVRIGDNKGARYASDNFWMMGDTGPCGPCTESVYDHGPEIAGGPPGSPNEDGDRYIEIWNNVFMQFNRDEAGVMHKLPKPSVDTGMGLERVTAVLQHVHSNYEIDTFVNLLAAAKAAVDASGGGDCDAASPSLKVIADHIRACTFTVVDGVIPSNAGRGYVLRRITRRAIVKGYQLGTFKPFFHTLVAALAAEMGDAYPELRQQQQRVTEVLKQVEEGFFRTIANGMEILDVATSELTTRAWLLKQGYEVDSQQAAGKFRLDFVATPKVGSPRWVEVKQVQTNASEKAYLGVKQVADYREKSPGTPMLILVCSADDKAFFESFAEEQMKSVPGIEVKAISPADVGSQTLSGDVVFRLHDTYGFPVDLTADVCRERGVTVDTARFDELLGEQRQRAREAGKFKMAQGLEYTGAATTFHGYDLHARDGAVVTAIYIDGTTATHARAGDDAVVVLDHTPFYAESGGQVGDTGELRNATSRFIVEDTIKVQASVFGHHGRVVEGELAVGDVLNAKIDAERRAKTVRNHSATHLMHKALREVLGAHVQQKGSLVTPERTRFDFAHNAPMTPAQIEKVEALVNAEVLANAATQAREMAIDDAQKSGAMMLFGEKYGDEVRVLDIGSSRELCGGTHVQRTGDIGLFKVVAESGVAAGVRRIEAITGDNALVYVQSMEHTMTGLASALKAAPAELPARLAQVLEQVRSLEKELTVARGKLASSQGDELLAQAVDVGGIQVLAATLQGADAKALRDTMDKLKDKLKTAAIVLATVDGGKVQIAAGITADVLAKPASKLKAGELVNFVAQQVGGKGGGKADMAMAGGTDAAGLPAALASVRAWVAERV